MKRFLRMRGSVATSLLLSSLLVTAFIAAQFGALALDLQAWAFWKESAEVTSALVSQSHLLWHIRIPRVVFAGLVGACLGCSGALTQALFRNPLAEPGLLGVSSGAACAASVSIIVLAYIPYLNELSGHWLVLPLVTFFGALSVCLLLDVISRKLIAGSMSALLLTGIALNALTGAVIGLCAYIATDTQLRSLTFWTLGSLASASWALIGVASILLISICLFTRTIIQPLNALMLGESIARHIGVSLSCLRIRVIILVAFMAGFAVAFCGVIGFIGLAAPHLVRLIVGADLRAVFPRSGVVGAILLIVSDTFARSVAAPAEVPVGVFTALLGSMFFFWLLARYRRSAI